jgi:hypothetical protein
MEIPNLKKATTPICQKARELRINRKDCKILISGWDKGEEVRLSRFLFSRPKIKKVSKARTAVVPPAMMKIILHPIVDVR